MGSKCKLPRSRQWPFSFLSQCVYSDPTCGGTKSMTNIFIWVKVFNNEMQQTVYLLVTLHEGRLSYNGRKKLSMLFKKFD